MAIDEQSLNEYIMDKNITNREFFPIIMAIDEQSLNEYIMDKNITK